jgi:hypothetical protein
LRAAVETTTSTRLIRDSYITHDASACWKKVPDKNRTAPHHIFRACVEVEVKMNLSPCSETTSDCLFAFDDRTVASGSDVRTSRATTFDSFSLDSFASSAFTA